MKKILTALVLISGIFAFSLSIYDGGPTKYADVDIDKLSYILESHLDKIDKKRKGNDLYVLTKAEKEELDNIVIEASVKIIESVKKEAEKHEIDELEEELKLFRMKLKDAKTMSDYKKIGDGL
ncbi:hypothetical protein [Oceanivirga salmonicida]|uniref:hypothetical protein n=1 Tax=Oceanivirga salmonicida TaxID=1769291 RepID=UPI0012E2B098|nr:hypothetical protein [Oceanivirga salmonicida]